MQTKQQKKIHALSGKKGTGLNSVTLNLSDAGMNINEQIKKRHTDNKGRFSHINPRTHKKELLNLEDIKRFGNTKNEFVLKGTSKVDQKPVTKLITVKVK